jgi:exopolyphosphatase/guanosine-5'-triphosphate,3'-diphosphate pyrophosphatase
MVNDDVWQRLKIDLKEIAKNHPGIEAIGSGGNINKILSIQRNDSKLNYKEIKQIYNELSPLSIEERMDLYILKKDRADVIVPALLIYYNIMKWANIEDINVPKIGLVDGLIHHLYELVLAD